ncbi:hypothetical protein Pcinc_014469 [Petrolisthes cinctipes]|uniref:THAP-type domain-containing protein n=1 Tax=Petrolisthes cinctipes TaxID=88211 RepID=A0AAE1G094_PETCI|nr:hypothetical protein Pcinc_014469 [Petrolisthes cinctipes]
MTKNYENNNEENKEKKTHLNQPTTEETNENVNLQQPYIENENSCTNTDKVPGRSFYRIPKVCKNQGVAHEKLLTERRNLWFSRISRMITSNPEHWRVCGNHFVSGAPSKLYDKANPDWAPTQQLGHTKFKSRLSSPRKSERKHERTAPRPKRAAEVDAAMTLHQMRTKKDAGQATVIPDDGSSFEASSVAAGSECQGHSTTSSASQTDITSDMINFVLE